MTSCRLRKLCLCFENRTRHRDYEIGVVNGQRCLVQDRGSIRLCTEMFTKEANCLDPLAGYRHCCHVSLAFLMLSFRFFQECCVCLYSQEALPLSLGKRSRQTADVVQKDQEIPTPVPRIPGSTATPRLHPTARGSGTMVSNQSKMGPIRPRKSRSRSLHSLPAQLFSAVPPLCSSAKQPS